MKHLPLITFLILMLVNISVIGSAEYIFKKDGSIIKCTIVADTPSFLTVKSESGATIRVGRDDLMRILYTDLYMGKVYIRLTSGEVVEGYQVDEDRDNYVFRKDITKPEEFTVPRKKVMFIARTNPTDLTSDASIERIRIKWSPPFKPAKVYKIYIREAKKGVKFEFAGETADLTYNLKNLNKSASYEVYVTAVSDSGEESLPSEKIITNTIPYPPEDLRMTEKYSQDGKKVTLSMTWLPVKDIDSRVKSYSIYDIDDQRKKLGTTNGLEFVIKDFPAEGRHHFAVVAVNDLGVESEDVVTVYDAGFKIYTTVTGAYLLPFGDLGVIADSGYAGLLDISIGIKSYSAGIETGYMTFNCIDKDIKNMSIIPVLAIADYRIPVVSTLFVRPIVKAGGAYQMTEYIRYRPLITESYKKNGFDPMASIGAYIDLGITDYLKITAGAEYSALFQKSGIMRFASFQLGAVALF